jgi:hypothetical protein
MIEMKHKSFGAVGTPEFKQELSENDLQSLIELGCIYEDVKIGNKNFLMRTLNASEKLYLAKLAVEDQTAEGLFNLNIKVLAISIQKVNGKFLEEFVPEEKDTLQAKCEIISQFQSPVINRLLEFYNEIATRGDAQFTVQQIKNS